ncbi:MAG: DUF2155 domain-containing protein [Pseudomonadota bacterium]|nr:DUF2155 domain-containing protein [Pseudomonadota bacterium]
MRSARLVRGVFCAGLLATGVAAAQDAQEQSSPDVPAPEAPFDENPFDEVVPETESELDILSRSTADPFPSLNETQNRRPVSVTLRALDKITARYTDIEAPIGEVAHFNSLDILPRFCDKRPPEEFPETTAFLEIFDRDLARARASASAALKEGKVAPAPEPTVVSQPSDEMADHSFPAADQEPIDPDRIFAGWMFASSPSLNALEHPVYDVWVIDCKTEIVESDEPAL